MLTVMLHNVRGYIKKSSIKIFMIDSDQRVSAGRIITENQKGSIPFLAKLLVSVWSTD